jgi:hypothetical protein
VIPDYPNIPASIGEMCCHEISSVDFKKNDKFELLFNNFTAQQSDIQKQRREVRAPRPLDNSHGNQLCCKAEGGVPTAGSR